jgi:hypothetical protein
MTKFNENKENIKLITYSKVLTNVSDARKNRAIAKKFQMIRQELNEKIGISRHFKIPIRKTEPKVEKSETRGNLQDLIRVNDNLHDKPLKKNETKLKPAPFVYKLAMKSLNPHF